jgi:hypothetical protein
MLGSEEMREWTDLQKLLSDVRLTQQEDIISWGLTPSKVFETSSLYRFMTDGGMDSRLAVRIWKCKIPLKIRIFLWQAFQNRIQTAQQLKSMNWRGGVRDVCCVANQRMLTTCYLNVHWKNLCGLSWVRR